MVAGLNFSQTGQSGIGDEQQVLHQNNPLALLEKQSSAVEGMDAIMDMNTSKMFR